VLPPAHTQSQEPTSSGVCAAAPPTVGASHLSHTTHHLPARPGTCSGSSAPRSPPATPAGRSCDTIRRQPLRRPGGPAPPMPRPCPAGPRRSTAEPPERRRHAPRCVPPAGIRHPPRSLRRDRSKTQHGRPNRTRSLRMRAPYGAAYARTGFSLRHASPCTRAHHAPPATGAWLGFAPDMPGRTTADFAVRPPGHTAPPPTQRRRR
jgi:hypothetical protein